MWNACTASLLRMVLCLGHEKCDRNELISIPQFHIRANGMPMDLHSRQPMLIESHWKVPSNPYKIRTMVMVNHSAANEEKTHAHNIMCIKNFSRHFNKSIVADKRQGPWSVWCVHKRNRNDGPIYVLHFVDGVWNDEWKIVTSTHLPMNTLYAFSTRHTFVRAFFHGLLSTKHECVHK